MNLASLSDVVLVGGASVDHAPRLAFSVERLAGGDVRMILASMPGAEDVGVGASRNGGASDED